MKSLFWKSCFPLFCILLIDAMSYGIVMPVLAPLLLETSSSFLPADTSLHIRTFYYGLSMALPMACTFLGAPILGDLSDQIGRKKTLLLALLGLVFSCCLSAIGVVIGSILLLLIGRGILGLMDSNESVAKAAIADISGTPKQKAFNLSMASLAGTFGFLLGPMLGGLVTQPSTNPWLGYTVPFLLAAALALLNAIFLHVSFTETYKPNPQKQKIKLLASFKNLSAAFLDKRLRTLGIVFFCLQFCWGTYFQTIAILLYQSLHYTPQKIGFFLSGLSVCFAITLSIIIKILIELFQPRSIVIIGGSFLVAGSFVVTLFSSETSIWLSGALMCLGVAISYNILLAMFSDSVSEDNQGRIMGVSVALYSSAWVISSIIGGLLSSVHLKLPYVMMTAVAICGLIVTFYIKTNRKASLEQPLNN